MEIYALLIVIFWYLMVGAIVALWVAGTDAEAEEFGLVLLVWPTVLTFGAFVYFVKFCVDLCAWLQKKIRRFWRKRDKEKGRK